MLGNLFGKTEQETEEHWVSISDVMAGLMVIFLFIAISYMVNANRKTERITNLRDRIENLLDAYKNLQADLSDELLQEFKGNPTKMRQFEVTWRGHLDAETLSIGFKKPFTRGEATVPKPFKSVLRNFFPRYIAILTKSEYKDSIEEVRIEGHTSSEWFAQIPINQAYMNNMELSQDRARNVLDYVLGINHPKIIRNKVWLKKKVTANGLSSSQLLLHLTRNGLNSASSFDVVAKESSIPLWKISRLHQRIRSWPQNKKVTRQTLIDNLILDFPEFKQRTVDLERAIDLLMENKEASRRVEFRVVTKSEKLIDEIQQLMEEFDK